MSPTAIAVVLKAIDLGLMYADGYMQAKDKLENLRVLVTALQEDGEQLDAAAWAMLNAEIDDAVSQIVTAAEEASNG